MVQTKVPRYREIADNLTRDIFSGSLTAGSKLPPERKLALELGVAVGTLRQALSELTERGLLHRRQGAGNFIAPGANSLREYFRLEKISGQGTPRSEVISQDLILDGAPHSSLVGQKFLRFRRVRYFDDQAVAAEEIWFDATESNDTVVEDVPDTLYLFYQAHFGVVVTKVEDNISIGQAPDWIPSELDSIRNQHCLLIERIAQDDHGRVVEASQMWVDQNLAHYVNRLS